MKLSLILTRNRLTETLRWIGFNAGQGRPLSDGRKPGRFAEHARRVAKRGFGERL
ncbi:MAG: hypothetical protein MUC58_12795 [Rhizobiaceae bacterium]|jgi:hypothetical protein|nr:hypothetical protein [Rhizobiaceae bacterium]